MTQLLQKHSAWQEDRRPMMWHGSVMRPTLYLASMDIKTAFNVARPKHIAKIMKIHDVHEWIIAALLLEMAGLEGQARGEYILLCEMRPPRERRSPCPLAQNGADSWECRTRTDEEQDRRAPGNPRRASSSDTQFDAGRQLLDHVSLKGASGDDEGYDWGGGEVGPGAETRKSVLGQALVT